MWFLIIYLGSGLLWCVLSFLRGEWAIRWSPEGAMGHTWKNGKWHLKYVGLYEDVYQEWRNNPERWNVNVHWYD